MFQQPEQVENVHKDQTEAVTEKTPGDDAGLTLDQHLDSLWQRTLFRPERTEAVSLQQKNKEDNDEPEKPKRKRVEMELIGLGRIGNNFAAVIRVKKKRRRGQETDNLKKNVYRLDDDIRDTGFKVSSIALNGVILNRGDETRELTLTTSDDASEKRRKQAVQAEKRKDRERKKRQEEKKEAPKPPPPPPAPGGADSDTEKESDREEQKRKRQAEEEERSPKTLEHTASPDETLRMIADMYESEVDTIIKANEDIESTDDLEGGMTVTVPYD